MVKSIKTEYCRCPLPLEQVMIGTPSLSPFRDKYAMAGTPSLSPFRDEHETTGTPSLPPF